MLKFDKLKELLISNNSFLITTHVNPDADAIGSEMALYHVLKELDKNVTVINHSAMPSNLLFLDKENIIKKYNPLSDKTIFETVDVLIALDLNHSSRIVSMTENFVKSHKLKICIDHHQDPENFAEYQFIDDNYTSTGEIIYDFINSTQIVDLNRDISTAIYAAIMTDTGSFRFERTSARTHRFVAGLLEHGADPTNIYYEIYDRGTFNKTKLLGISLNSLKLDKTGQIGHMIITQQDLLNTGAEEPDVDGFVNYCLSIDGVKIGLLFFELEDGIKISVRSRGDIPANKIAGDFNGGGHLNAAGARLYQCQIRRDQKQSVKYSSKLFINTIIFFH